MRKVDGWHDLAQGTANAAQSERQGLSSRTVRAGLGGLLCGRSTTCTEEPTNPLLTQRLAAAHRRHSGGTPPARGGGQIIHLHRREDRS